MRIAINYQQSTMKQNRQLVREPVRGHFSRSQRTTWVLTMDPKGRPSVIPAMNAPEGVVKQVADGESSGFMDGNSLQ